MVSYISTRTKTRADGFTDVLLTGLAPDGGLFVPETFPVIDFSGLAGRPYAEIAYHVTAPFLGDEIDSATYQAMLKEVYGQFTHSAVAPLVQLGPNAWVMELFHGPTIAFKDYALQLLGRLFDHVLEKRKARITIVGATSGDTGSAAIEGCRTCHNVDIFILHPEGRTSEVQRRQMTTVLSPNVFNIALEGTFDDCQNMVKALFADQPFREKMNLSAVNSINWARIMAQTVYYVTAALALGGSARPVTFAVPTGNFGNVYAAYVARRMGLNIGKLVIGSNRNDILTRFFETGIMKASGVEPSLSPSMDIQISSNFERYLFDLTGRDASALSALMTGFKETGKFSLPDGLMARARQEFTADRCSDDQTIQMMAECYRETGYVIDPHTAVGLYAGWKSVGQDLSAPLVALACAHPAKFPEAVKRATGIHPPLPLHLKDLYDRPERYTVLQNDKAAVQDFITSHARR